MLDEMHGRDRLSAALRNSSTFPRNVFEGEVQEYSLKALETLLEKRSEDLFCDITSASVVLFELYNEERGYRKKALKDFDSFNQMLTAPLNSYRPDPQKRFFFVKAPSSRDPLSITRRMLLHLLTYHQVMPAFLHYIFPFGDQHYVRDFHVMGYRSNTCVEVPKQNLAIPNICRSGRHVELCYSLKSVEPTPDQSTSWSIRQCSVYHRFDLVHEQSTWIIVKANPLIQQAVQNQCGTAHNSNSAENQPLSATLAVHRILAEWAGENWHWYINDLESEFQEKTGRSLYISLESTVSGSQPKRSSTINSESSPKTQRRRSSLYAPVRALSKVFHRSNSEATWPSGDTTILGEETHELSPLKSESSDERRVAIDDFSFQDLQDVHYYEMKANEASLILKANSKVIGDLRNEYKALMLNNNCPSTLRENYQSDILLFEQKLAITEQDMAMQQSKVDILLRMIAARKVLMQGILQMRNTQSTNRLAERAQESAKNMEHMTVEMHAIAKKTKVETVSMRIITLVTLFFLPGTFISTLMSTPMVKFNSTSPGFSIKNIGVGALQLYLLVSLPLVCVTFLAWFAVHRWEKRMANKSDEKMARSEEDDIEAQRKTPAKIMPGERCATPAPLEHGGIQEAITERCADRGAGAANP